MSQQVPTPKSKKRSTAISIALTVLAVLLLVAIVLLMANPCPPGEPVPASQQVPPVEISQGSSGDDSTSTGDRK